MVRHCDLCAATQQFRAVPQNRHLSPHRLPGKRVAMNSVALRLLAMAFVLTAAAPSPPLATEPLAARIIADSRASSPAAIAFDRTTKSVRTGGGSTTNTLKVERWDGRKWSLVTVNGRKPTTNQRAEAERIAAAAPVPGYHRLAPLLAAATETATDAQGRTVLKIPILPVGSVRTDSSDISRHLSGEVTLARGDRPYVERVRVTAREPFKMNMLIKVLTFEQVSEYRLDAAGKPRLASQIANSQGTMFGFPGGEKSEVTYSYR